MTEMTAGDYGARREEIIAAVHGLADACPAMTVHDGAARIADLVLGFAPGRSAVAATWAAAAVRILDEENSDRVESEFPDPATGGLFAFIVERRLRLPEWPEAADRGQDRIRARGRALERLAMSPEHREEFAKYYHEEYQGHASAVPARRKALEG